MSSHASSSRRPSTSAKSKRRDADVESLPEAKVARRPSTRQQTSGRRNELAGADHIEVSAACLPDNAAERLQEHQERLRRVMQEMTPEQLQRLEKLRRSTLNRTTVHTIMQEKLPPGTILTPTMTLIVGGAAKAFLVELIEQADVIRRKSGVEGPVRPVHVAEAYRCMQEQRLVPGLMPGGFPLL
eukprot:TRINITY_DN9567_c0_g1_i1.p1 TRINITY_DN9567_c0_g1~~TRINITY_DN9567_c0_g1_i1.p1  ORF type:complete len:193 (-),score=20.01 TRINITY_DN9567_c0_g1_i1:49-603(-)